MDLDAFDQKILAHLQRNNRLTNEELGDAVGLSPTAVSRRVRQMREAGVIVADVTIVNDKLQGPSVTAFVLCKLDRGEEDTWLRFAAHLRNSPEVLSAITVTGEVDVVFQIMTSSIETYEAFLGRLFNAFPTLRNITTHVALTHIKRAYIVTLESPATA